MASFGITNSVASPVLVSASRPEISSCKILLSSCIPRYLSAATRLDTGNNFKVVSTTSDATRISSKLSKTASSTLDFPATALLSLERKLF
jgi:hypothetical protein